MAAQAHKQAESGNKYYDAFFGKIPNDRLHPNDASMKDRFNTLANIQATPNKRAGSNGYYTLRCDAENTPRPECRGFGAPMMTVLSTGEMWVCRSFWRGQHTLVQLGPPPRRVQRRLDTFVPTGGIILHELAHAVFEAVGQNLTDKATRMYDHERTLRGVKQRGARGFAIGRTNADSYRMFAAAAYWSAVSKSSWSADPDRLESDSEL